MLTGYSGPGATVAEQLGKTVAPGPLYPVSIVLSALAECSGTETHRDVIEALISGETVASWAVYEPGQGWAPASTRSLTPSMR
ncbi:hypothetical protein MAHJHV33_48270 [Mycobacterium avium subsp. hominissuis]